MCSGEGTVSSLSTAKCRGVLAFSMGQLDTVMCIIHYSLCICSQIVQEVEIFHAMDMELVR